MPQAKSGKSTLAAKIYEDDSTEFSNKFLVDVSRVGFTELARRVWLRLGLSRATVDGIPEISLVDALINHLRKRKYLLIIDNLESWLTENGQWLNQIYQDFFLGWIECGGESVVLVTTRERPTLREIKSQWLPYLPKNSPCDDTGTSHNLPNNSPCDDTAINYNMPNSSVGAKHLGDNLSRETQILSPNASPCDDTAINHNLPNNSPLSDSSEDNISAPPKIDPPNASPLQIEIESDNIKTIEEDLRQLAKRSLLQEERDKDRVRWFQFQPFIQEYAKHKAGDSTAAHQRAINYYLYQLAMGVNQKLNLAESASCQVIATATAVRTF